MFSVQLFSCPLPHQLDGNWLRPAIKSTCNCILVMAPWPIRNFSPSWDYSWLADETAKTIVLNCSDRCSGQSHCLHHGYRKAESYCNGINYLLELKCMTHKNKISCRNKVIIVLVKYVWKYILLIWKNQYFSRFIWVHLCSNCGMSFFNTISSCSRIGMPLRVDYCSLICSVGGPYRKEQGCRIERI